MSKISFKEFQQVEMKAAEILSVEDHPNADKLYVLQVDLGDGDKRQLVAGIREDYGKDELVGKKIIVVSNLEPANLRGVESQGMLLAAQGENKIELLTVEDTKNGSKVL